MKQSQEKVINDLLYFNNIKIIQNKNYFNFSLDSILLPNFVEITPSIKKIIDLCTGNAPIPLVLSTRTNCKIYGVEIQKEIYDLAQETIKLNDIQNIEIINKDVKDIYNLFETDTFDIVTCNPPYFKYQNDSRINQNEIKSIARHEILIDLEEIIKISRKILKNGGSLNIVHRTSRLVEIIELLKKYNFEPKRIRFIYPKLNSESNLVLIDARKNGKSGLKILSPLYVHNEDGTYTSEVLKMFGDKNDTKKL